jgi:hypothetical protein
MGIEEAGEMAETCEIGVGGLEVDERGESEDVAKRASHVDGERGPFDAVQLELA